MAQYIEIISKIKQKNNQTFKLLDLTDVQVNLQTQDYNVLCANGDTITKSGIDWDLNQNFCTIGGDLHIAGSLFENSDIQLKSNIIHISNPLDTIKKLNGVQFNWKKDGKLDYGLIAQQVEKIIPEMVSHVSSSGYKQIAYIKLIPFLLESIKELNKRIETLESHKFSWVKSLSKIIKKNIQLSN